MQKQLSAAMHTQILAIRIQNVAISLHFSSDFRALLPMRLDSHFIHRNNFGFSVEVLYTENDFL